jgi:hypothetical protein
MSKQIGKLYIDVDMRRVDDKPRSEDNYIRIARVSCGEDYIDIRDEEIPGLISYLAAILNELE